MFDIFQNKIKPGDIVQIYFDPYVNQSIYSFLRINKNYFIVDFEKNYCDYLHKWFYDVKFLKNDSIQKLSFHMNEPEKIFLIVSDTKVKNRLTTD